MKKPSGYWNSYDHCYDEAKKYNSRSEFLDNSQMAYNSARKNGWLDDYTWFERPVAYNKKWNRETCYEEAKNYKSKTEFRKNSGGAYKVAYNNGWFDDYSWFESNQKPNGYWNRKTCYDEATRYKSRGEFAKRSNSAYKVAKKNGWLNDYTWFEKLWEKKWNRETCYEEAIKYKSKVEFQKKNGSAYTTANKNRWLDDYTWFERPIIHNKKWNYETCFEEAKKYYSKAEFRKSNSSAYNVAYKNGWFDDYSWFKDGNKTAVEKSRKWNRETCYEEAKKYNSKAEFRKNRNWAYSVAYKNGWMDDYTWFENGVISKRKIYVVYYYIDDETNAVYVGLTNNLKRRRRQHIKDENDTVYKYFSQIGKQVPEPIVLEKGLFAEEAQEREDYYIDFYNKEGKIVLNIAKAGSLGAYGKWTKEMTYEEAKKYKSRLEFEKGNNSAYNAAKRNGWLDEYTWFSPSAAISKWDYEACFEEAKKFNSRGEFQKKSVRAYNVALKNGWLNEYIWFLPSASAKKWNYNTCYEEAKKYNSKTEFRKFSSGAYNVAYKNGWLDGYSWFKKPTNWNKKWNRETCYEEAKKHKTKGTFIENASGAYNAARKNGWLDDYTWFENGKENGAEKRRKWNYEKCRNEAKKYTSRGEYAKNSKTAYQVARKNGWIGDYTWFK